MILRSLRLGLAGTLLAMGVLGCAEAPVKVADGIVEKPLEQASGMTTQDVANASQKKSLGLWDVYALAVERTEQLAIAQENVEQAHDQSMQAVGAWLPQVALNAGKAFQSSKLLGLSVSFPSNPSSNIYLSGAETILSGLNQVAAIQGAQATVNEQVFNVQDQAAQLLTTVAQEFYSILQLQDTLRITQESVTLSQKTYEIEQRWQRIGRAAKSDLLSTKAQLDQAVGTLTDTQNQLDQAQEALAEVANIPSNSILSLSDETLTPPAFSLDDELSKIQDRPDIKAAQAAADVADAYCLQAHGEHLPSLLVEGDYYLDHEGNPQPEWDLDLVASLPIFEGGQIVATEREMDSKKRQADLQLSLTEREAKEQVRQAYEGLMDSIQSAQAYQKALASSQAAYEAVLSDYHLSLVTNLDVLTALNNLETAKTNYSKAYYQTLLDQITLEIATGDLPKRGPIPDGPKGATP